MTFSKEPVKCKIVLKNRWGSNKQINKQTCILTVKWAYKSNTRLVQTYGFVTQVTNKTNIT